MTVQGQSRPIVRNVMTLRGCAPIVGAEVMSFQDEPSMLRVRLDAYCSSTAPVPAAEHLGWVCKSASTGATTPDIWCSSLPAYWPHGPTSPLVGLF